MLPGAIAGCNDVEQGNRLVDATLVHIVAAELIMQTVSGTFHPEPAIHMLYGNLPATTGAAS